MLPYVVKVNRKRSNFTLYIGREFGGLPASKWQNPFYIHQYGRKGCIELYEHRIRKTPELMAALHELSDQALGCWCYPEDCHGDVLVKLYKETQKPGIGDMANAVSEAGCLVLPEPRMVIEEYTESLDNWVRFDGQLGYYPKEQVVWP